MYLDHYSLKRQPFKLSSDPDFLWAGGRHRAALNTLKEGILERAGFVLLTGDVGTGKSTLVEAFPHLNEIATITVTIPDPDLAPLDFLNFLSKEFGMGRRFTDREEFLRHFKSFLLGSYAVYSKVLVIIDEAQRLNSVLLAEIRQLARIEMAGRRMLKIFFVGQTEFNDLLMDERNVAVRKEIVAAHHIQPLDAREAAHYIGHRLAVAGAKRNIFTHRAIARIHALAAGYPRTINVLCDHCLLRGFSTGAKLIDADTVDVCARALHLKPLAAAPRDYAFPFPVKAAADKKIPIRVRRFKPIARTLTGIATLLLAAALILYFAYRFGLLDRLFQS
ncbi:MAG: AAA family ATPase [Desulfobacterales bacterium]